MATTRVLRDIIIGKGRHIESRREYKSSMLLGELCMVGLGSVFFCFIADIALDLLTQWNIIVYTLYVILTSIVLVLNRLNHRKLGAIIWLLISNFFITAYADSDQSASVFYFPLAMASVSLFSQDNRLIGFLLALLSFLLLVIAYSYNLNLIPIVTNNNNSLNGLINYSMAFFDSLLLIFFLLNLNYNSEKNLSKSEEMLRLSANQLEKSRQRFEFAIAGSNTGIWEWNIKDNNLYHSPHWKWMLGFRDNELADMTLEEIMERVHPEDKDQLKQALNNHLEKKIPFRIEYRMLKKDNSIIWVADSGEVVMGENGSPILMAGSIIDITERKEVQQKIIHQNELLVKANSELDRFVYSASHDLRSPLSSILGLINISKKSTSSEEIGMCLNLMTEQIQTLENFISEIQDYSRNSRLEIAVEKVKLSELITDIVKALSYSERADTIHFHNMVPTTLMITTDKTRLKIVLSNLIGNAIKYSDLKKNYPSVILKAEVNEAIATISIIDNGIGIDKAQQPKIFDMFYRASESSKGSGLGLYIVKESLDKLHGEIRVESEIGIGSTFNIYLPNFNK